MNKLPDNIAHIMATRHCNPAAANKKTQVKNWTNQPTIEEYMQQVISLMHDQLILAASIVAGIITQPVE